jgi:predicted ATPase
MRPTHIKIGHYRALRGISVPLGDYTAMVGPNGVGKSTVLDAVDFFLDPDSNVHDDDFQRGCEEAVSVTMTFTDLNEEECGQYNDVLDENGSLTVTKTCGPGESPRYEVAGMRHAGFDDIRRVERTASKSEFNAEFKAFAATSSYGLKPGRSAADNLAELRRWEEQHQDKCQPALVPFSFIGSTKDQLIPTLRFVYVPAVQEASDMMGGARAPLTQMLRAFVYPRFESDEQFLELQEQVAQRYAAMFPTDGTPELITLGKQITGALDTFCPGASLTLGWAEYEEALQIPAVVPQVVEDGVGTDVERKGHGLQRALIIAMLQAEGEHRRTSDGSVGGAHVVLMIEEPELYQHPTQCRHFRRVLTNLATASSGIRVLVTTHSPDFISLDGIDSIRILRREQAENAVPGRKLSSVSLDAIAERYSEVADKPIDQQYMLRQLHVVDNVMREAFFANAAVLVEGDGDRGLIAAQCALDGLDLEGKGIVIIACGGKSTMSLPICILRLLGIKHYAVFDSDRDPTQNKPLLRALGLSDKSIAKTETPSTGAFNSFAVLQPKMEDVLKASVGEAAFNDATLAVGDEFGRAPDQTLKNPVTAERVLARLRDAGRVCDTLYEIATRIASL